jgi:glycosyltransferase involved in cell wall biosynthesis
MKIAFLANHNVIHTIRWANSLAARKNEVTVFSLHRHEQDGLSPAVKKVRLPFPPPWGYFLNAPYLRYCLQKFSPDLLNAHYASGYGTLGRLSGFHPYLLSVWGSDIYDFPHQSAKKHSLLVRNLASADLICSTSHAMAREARKIYPLLEDIVITPFGVDIEKFRPIESREDDGGDVTIGTVKKLECKYGIDTLMRSFALLREMLLETQPNLAAKLRLLVVGSGSEKAMLCDLAVELGIKEIVTFTGSIRHDQVPHFLNKMDIYVALSRLDSESFGVAILEASACAVPVVVSDADGPAEVVLDGETGLIVPREDPAEAAAALKRLVVDRDLRQRLGEAGRKHVMSNYEWEHCVDIMENTFKQIAAAVRR